jgi:hypothetical protein
MSFTPFPPGPPVAQPITSAVAGYTLINGTGNILVYNVPNDGLVHTVNVATNMNVASLETGGQIQVLFTTPDGTAQTFQQHAAGLAAGLARTNSACLCKPGTTVTLQQSTALTAGAATLWGSMWSA